jgi:4-aminobutyrate aminotransferase-like enzyme
MSLRRVDLNGPRTTALRATLRAHESPGITTIGPRWPIFWERGVGSHVYDVDGNEFIDLTAAFGVAALGHGSPIIADAVSAQARLLLHGMGDVHPPVLKARLLERLAGMAPDGLTFGALGLNGADAVETALKCAALVTGKAGVIAFEGAYHGVYGGALEVTSRRDFRDPFAMRSTGRTTFARYPRTAFEADEVLAELERKLSGRSSGLVPTGALIIEPILGRGGIVAPPPGFLTGLRSLCDRHGLMFIVDEILTGLGRTGTLFAIDAEGVRPDLLCLGKALAGGMPLSVCLGHADSLGRWPAARGEAWHTATFLGHPGSCAAALASLDAITSQQLWLRAADLGERAAERLRRMDVGPVRGRGLMLGVELSSGAHGVRAMERALEYGVILLVEGPEGEVVSVIPPLVIDEAVLMTALDIVEVAIRETA